MSESTFLRRVLIEAPHHGVILFRNNVGMCRAADGRVVKFGLAKGSSDLIGWTMHAGRAIFTAAEIKTRTGRLRPEQINFLAAVERDGGRAIVLREGDDIAAALRITEGMK